jgi:hypothetical protein
MSRIPLIFPLGVAFALAAACATSSPEAHLCQDVPAGGCPLSYGVACDDPACAAAYACNPDGTWTLDHVCPARDAGDDAANASDAGDAEAAAPPSFDAAGIDAPPGAGGGPGCVDPEPPDCWLDQALACSGSSDPCCGCEELYVCTLGTQVPWGYCSVDGGIVQRP